MINTASDYNWISGDFDPSSGYPLINGEIMPLRTGTSATGVENSKILRGEDVCFLAEAAKERNYCFNGSVVRSFKDGVYQMETIDIPEVTFDFSKKISAAQMQTLVGLYTDLFSRTPQLLQRTTPFFIDKTKLAPETIGLNSDIMSRLGQIFDSAAITPSMQTSSASDFISGGVLQQSDIQKIFDDLSLLDAVVTKASMYMTNDTQYEDVEGDTWAPSYNSSPSYNARNNPQIQSAGQFYYMPNYITASIPAQYFSAAEVWSCYSIIGRSYWTPSFYSADFKFDKVADMTLENDEYIFRPTVAQVKTLINERLQTVGEQIRPYNSIPSGTRNSVQFAMLYVPSGLFIIATLSDRTKWQLSNQSS